MFRVHLTGNHLQKKMNTMTEIEEKLNDYVLKEFDELGRDYYFLECWQEVSDVVFEFVKFQCDLKEKTK